MCLAPSDYISDRIRATGRWHDCVSHVKLWQSLDGRVVRKRWLPLPLAGDPDGVLLALGANIGACTVELLVRTRARIIAFEPSPANLFHLTRSLRSLASAIPDVAECVVVFPIALGDRPTAAQIVGEVGNLGNSVVLLSPPSRRPRRASHRSTGDTSTATAAAAAAVTDDDRSRASRASGLVMDPLSPRYHPRLNVSVLRLDDLFPRGLGGTRMLKIDVQVAYVSL